MDREKARREAELGRLTQAGSLLIRRPQALFQGVKFPGAFAFACDLLVGDSLVASVRTLEGSTAHSGLYRLAESAAGGRNPDAGSRTYWVGARGVNGGTNFFTIGKPERLRAPVAILRDQQALGVLRPHATTTLSFRLETPDKHIADFVSPSIRGLDFDVSSEDLGLLATVRMVRRDPMSVVTRRATRLALTFATGGMVDPSTSDAFEVNFTQTTDTDLRLLLIASAVAATAERGVGSAAGVVGNLVSGLGKLSQSVADSMTMHSDPQRPGSRPGQPQGSTEGDYAGPPLPPADPNSADR